MIIVPTRICNTNKCNYCGVYKKDFELNYFDSFFIEDFYEKIFFLSNSLGDFNLRFFGGEPFLKFDIIKEIITFFKQKTDKFNFIINTNLTLINDEKINFLKENNVKLIISCNGKIKTHSISRGISISETTKLYKNIKLINSSEIENQINIVSDSSNSEFLVENIEFIVNNLGSNNINLLPVNYRGWNEKGIKNFENSLEKISKKIKSNNLRVNFINKEVSNSVALFNSEFFIDSDGCIYPSSIVIEEFFLLQKNKVLISNLNKNLEELKKDLLFWENDNHLIYSVFINKFLNNYFKSKIQQDNNVSQIFHQFLSQI